jgi:hypothetical protein
MGMDRFIKWKKPKEWGPPTLQKLMIVAQEFLGPRWKVWISDADRADGEPPCWIACETDEDQTWPLVTEYVPSQEHDGPPTQEEVDRFRKAYAKSSRKRGFEIYFPGPYGSRQGQSSVITRLADEFTNALADQFTRIIARWWNGKVKWPS